MNTINFENAQVLSVPFEKTCFKDKPNCCLSVIELITSEELSF